jgi:SAM-dependent methyltransferase
MLGGPDSRAYWDRAARTRPAWYIATGHQDMTEAFFQQGAQEVDELLAHTGVSVQTGDRLVEIGCGAGRMTRRLAEVAGEVVALDVSPEMLKLVRENLAGVPNVEFVLGSGQDLRQLPDGSVDVVFSYVTLQHVPTREAQLEYLRETCRVLRPGGRAALQVRAPGVRPALLDLAGQVGRALRGRQTLCREWRGVRLRRADILRAVQHLEVSVDLRMRGSRHLWVVLRRGQTSS